MPLDFLIEQARAAASTALATGDLEKEIASQTNKDIYIYISQRHCGFEHVLGEPSLSVVLRFRGNSGNGNMQVRGSKSSCIARVELAVKPPMQLHSCITAHVLCIFKPSNLLSRQVQAEKQPSPWKKIEFRSDRRQHSLHGPELGLLTVRSSTFHLKI